MDTLLRALYFAALAVVTLVLSRYAAALVALATAFLFCALWIAKRRRTYLRCCRGE